MTVATWRDTFWTSDNQVCGLVWSQAQTEVGWRQVDFNGLVEMIVEAHLAAAARFPQPA